MLIADDKCDSKLREVMCWVRFDDRMLESISTQWAKWSVRSVIRLLGIGSKRVLIYSLYVNQHLKPSR